MKKLSLLFLAALALGSCKKNDDNAPSSSSKTDLLTAKNWRIATQTTTLTLLGTSTTSSTIDACDKDDFLKFNTDKSAVHDQGATKCDPTDPQTDKGNWDLSSDQSKLTINLPGYGFNSTSFDVKELSANTLHVYSTQSQSGATYTIDATFTSF